MTRKTTTVMLDSAGCGDSSAHVIEKALREVPGVLRAYVNPATEAAYVDYDADRCAEKDLERAIESVGVHTFHVEPPRGPVRFPPRLQRAPMPNTRTISRSWWAFAGFIAIAGFLLLTEHRAHLFGALPFLFLLACPFLHMFGHSGHGGHGSADDAGFDDSRDQAGARHQHHKAQDSSRSGNRDGATW